MKIYVVYRWVDYGNTEIVGVYRKEEDAQNSVFYHNKDNWDGVNYEEWEVE